MAKRVFKLTGAAHRCLVSLQEALRPGDYERHVSRPLRRAVEEMELRLATERQPRRTGYTTAHDIHIKSRDPRRPPALQPGTYRALRDLRVELGDDAFQKHIRRALRESMENWPKQLEQGIDTLRQFAQSNPWFVESSKRWNRAAKGDLDAICSCIEENLLGALGNQQIRERLRPRLGRRGERDTKTARRLANSFRKGLMGTGRGRPRKLFDPMQVVRLADQIQRRFEAAPITIRSRYRNEAALALDARDLSEFIASGFPKDARAGVSATLRELILQSGTAGQIVQWKEGFGVAAAAALCGYSPRQVRNLKRTVQG